MLLALSPLAALICWVLRAWGSAYLSPAIVWSPDAHADTLYVDGPFRFVRNPLYLGNIFLAAAVGIFATPYGFAFAVIGTAAFGALLSAYEARGMHERFGPVYDAYRRAVPALVPRFTPARIAGAARATPSFAYGLRSELLTACFVIGTTIAAFAPHRAAAAIGWSWFGGFVLQTVIAWREAR